MGINPRYKSVASLEDLSEMPVGFFCYELHDDGKMIARLLGDKDEKGLEYIFVSQGSPFREDSHIDFVKVPRKGIDFVNERYRHRIGITIAKGTYEEGRYLPNSGEWKALHKLLQKAKLWRNK